MGEVRASQTAQDRVDDAAARMLGVNRTDLRCLDIIDRHPGITAGELGRESGLTSGAVTAVLDRLERQGFVRRVRDPDDRRRVVVEFTPEAQARAQAIYEPIAREGAAIMERFTDRQLETVLDFVRIGRELNTALAEHLEPGRVGTSEFRDVVREQVRQVLDAAKRARDAGRELKTQAKEAKAELKAQVKGARRAP